MNWVDACSKAIAQCQKLQYIPDPPNDKWQGPSRTLLAGGGDCEDFAVLCITLAHEWCDVPKPTFRLVAGDTPNGRHAWVSITTNGEEFWCDPTPGYESKISPPSHWNRTPLYAYVYTSPVFTSREEWKV